MHRQGLCVFNILRVLFKLAILILVQFLKRKRATGVALEIVYFTRPLFCKFETELREKCLDLS